MPADRDLDKILDEALASYTAAEPDPSLRARIVVAAECASSRSPQFWFLFAATGIAAVVVTAVLVFTRAPQAPVAHPNSATPAAAVQPEENAYPAQPARPNRSHTVSVRHVEHHRVSRDLPRLATFPSPDSMTSDEEALMALTVNHPQEARHALSTVKTIQPLDPPRIQIAPINIAAFDLYYDPDRSKSR